MNPFNSYGGPAGAPEACEAIVLPETTNANCPNDYNAFESEITDIWISPVEESTPGAGDWAATAPPADWTSFADLNSTAGLKHLTIIGDKPLGEARIAALAKRWTKVIDRTHSLNIDVTDMSELNYEFIRTLQHQAPVAIWFKSYGEWVCGGELGIIVTIDTAGIVWGRGEGTLMTGQLVMKWYNLYDPPAVIGNNVASPLKAVKVPTPEELTAQMITGKPETKAIDKTGAAKEENKAA